MSVTLGALAALTNHIEIGKIQLLAFLLVMMD
jgi:hypothetical protein